MSVPSSFDPFTSIDDDSMGLANVAEHNLDVAVPSCPGWRMADLVYHLYRVQHTWGQTLFQQLTDPAAVAALDVRRPGNDRLVAAFRAGVSRFVTILQMTDPATPVWTWSTQHDAAFVIRHQVQEAAVHRWDAEHAVGTDYAIEPEPAVDGIDEFLTFCLRPRPADRPALDGPIALVATDTGECWLITESGDALSWVRGEVVREVPALRGTASELLLWAYGRVPAADLDVDGDLARLNRFAAYARTG